MQPGAEGYSAACSRHGLRSERGQAVVFLAVFLAVFLGIVGCVIDVGHAYVVKRKLQSAADAAALAGAAQLPDTVAAHNTAVSYGTSAVGQNRDSLLGPVSESVSLRCLVSFPGCAPANAVAVQETAQVSTFFVKLFGIDTFTVHATSTACSPCGSKPLDVMILLDRTLSMCMDSVGNYDASCTDLSNARSGIMSFLKLLDPARDNVGFAVLPPAPSSAKKCTAPPLTTAYDTKSSPYVLVPLSHDYATSAGVLNPASALISTINCVPGGGETAYALALEAAQAEFSAHGRSGVQRVILFFSDGAANTGPSWLPASSPYRVTPCHQGVSSAATIKSAGTLIYSIGYDLDALGGGANQCQSMDATGPLEKPAITAYAALQQIASPNDFYDQPTPDETSAIFTQVGSDILHGASRLVDDSTP